MTGTRAQQSTTQASIEGPIGGGKHGWPFAASLLDMQEFGYREEEYFLDGVATSYRPTTGAEFSRDGHWSAEPAGSAGFRTRFLVYRPEDPDRFNGSVVLTWNNVTAGYELFGADSRELFESGFALVCASVQKAGLEGLPPVRQGLRDWDPERYGSLSIPGDDYSFDIFTQIALAIGSHRQTGAVDPMAGLDVRRVIAQGASQSAGRLATYVNAIAPLTAAIDGFILSIYFGRGTPLEVGDTVVNINLPAEGNSTRTRLKGENLLRDDLGKPVFVVNSELEAIACHEVRQPDSDTFRYWETAGTCHVSAQSRATRQIMADRDQLVTRPSDEGINAIPMNPVYDAAYHHMHRWLTENQPPPVQPLIEFAGSPAEVIRDEHGIAMGGIRLPQAEVPLAQNSAIALTEDIYAVLGGSSVPFSRAKATGLYGDPETYLALFAQAAQAAVDAGVLRPREVARLKEEAQALAWQIFGG
jgi:hypothetical protein